MGIDMSTGGLNVLEQWKEVICLFDHLLSLLLLIEFALTLGLHTRSTFPLPQMV